MAGSTESNSGALAVSGAESSELDDGCDGPVGNRYSEFELLVLRRALMAEKAEERSDHERLAIAAHAVISESGFVRFDSVLGNRSHISDKFPTMGSNMLLFYTLPQILQNRTKSNNNSDVILLRFRSIGQFLYVYVSLKIYPLGPYCCLCLDEKRFGPMIEYVLGRKRNLNGRDAERAEREILEFWKIVKDEITLPLLFEVCENAGLPAPMGLMGLPSELKMKILESLPGADLAKVACVCKELRNRANDDEELWKHKFEKEFGIESDGTDAGGEDQQGKGLRKRMTQWKALFAEEWYFLRLNCPWLLRDDDPEILGGDSDGRDCDRNRPKRPARRPCHPPQGMASYNRLID